MHGDEAAAVRVTSKPRQFRPRLSPVVRLCLLKSALQGLENPGKPFIHNVNRTQPPKGQMQTCVLSMIASYFQEMVEPDGLEPTTSCLQSTRSTN